MISYESCNIDAGDPVSIYKTSDLVWDMHFHKAAEYVMVIDGEINCVINNEKYIIHKNEAVFILPNQIHSFNTSKHSEILIIRFSPKLAGSFFLQYKNKIPVNNLFEIDVMKVLNIRNLFSPNNLFELKGIIYTLIGIFCNHKNEWVEKETESNLIYSAIKYIEKHFTDKCSLKDAVSELNYDYTYISKEFLKVTGMTFVEYLNNCRINYACQLLETTNMSSTQVAYECGYNTLRTFNRNFIKYMKTTPKQYMKESS